MKILCLKGDHSIKNILSLYNMVKDGEYDYVDYSEAKIDSYVTLFLNSYNERVEIPLMDQLPSSSIIFAEILYFFRALKFGKIIFESCKDDCQKKFFYNNLILDLYQMGVQTFFIVAFISFFLGINVGYQFFVLLNEHGLADDGVSYIILLCFRQIGVLVSFMVFLTKYSSSIISKVGSMKISQEWVALDIMKIDPKIFIIKTKIYCLMILVPFFAYVSIFFSTIGAFWIFNVYHGVTLKFLLSTGMIRELKIFFTPLIKGIVMGGFLGIISSYEAMTIDKTSENIVHGLAHGVVMCLIIGLLVSIAFDLVFKF